MPAHSPFRPSALAAALLLALPAFAWAQSLQELYDAARAFDATYLAARATAASAEYRAAQSDALALPSLTATASGTNSQSDGTDRPPSSANTVSSGLNARYTLFNRANNATIAQARKLLETAQADLDTAEQDLILRVAQAYFDVLAAETALATTQANKAGSAEQLASAKRNFEVGTATITDTREAQARFDLGVAQEIAAENDLRTKRLALDTVVGRVGVTPKPLAVPVVLPLPSPANPEEWVTQADQLHPSVRRARVALEVAQLETAKAKAAGLPTLDAVAGLNGTYNTGTQPNASRSSGTSRVATVGLQMNWPLYAGGSIQNRVKETTALEEKSRNDLDAARRGTTQATRAAFFNLQSGLAQVKALEAAESSSKLALEATQLGYKVGVRVNLDVLNAQTQLFTTQRDLAKARYDVVLASLRLRQVSGQLSPTDVDAVNRLLAK